MSQQPPKICNNVFLVMPRKGPGARNRQQKIETGKLIIMLVNEKKKKNSRVSIKVKVYYKNHIFNKNIPNKKIRRGRDEKYQTKI